MPRASAAKLLDKARQEYDKELAVFKEVLWFSEASEEDIAKAFYPTGKKTPRERGYALYRKIAGWLCWQVRCSPAALEAAIKYVFPEPDSRNYIYWLHSFIR